MEPIQVVTARAFPDAEQAIRDALSDQGFSVITEIDVKATFAQKLGVGIAPMKILGACNAQLAYQALQVDANVSLVLPCNVVVAEQPDGTVRVSAVDPRQLMSDDRFTSLAEDAAAKLTAAVHHLAAIATS